VADEFVVGLFREFAAEGGLVFGEGAVFAQAVEHYHDFVEGAVACFVKLAHWVVVLVLGEAWGCAESGLDRAVRGGVVICHQVEGRAEIFAQRGVCGDWVREVGPNESDAESDDDGDQTIRC